MGKQLRGIKLIRRFLANPALRLAVFTGISSFAVAFAIGYFVQNSILSKKENVAGVPLFWLKYVATPLAVATLLGVLSSRARHGRHISPVQTIITVAVTPFVALCSFLAAYLILLAFHSGHYTPAFINLVFALGFGTVAIIVRWSVHCFCGLKKSSSVKA